MIARIIKARAAGFVHSEEGASLVEFAILLPVLALLMVGTIVFGQWMYFGILAANAARAGAQYGSQNLTTAANTSGMQSAALQDGQNLSQFSATPHCYYISGSTTTQCSLPATATPPPGAIYYVEVDTTGTFNPLIKYPGMPKNVTVSGKSIMRVVSQ
jgi:Flp pilus assembly protein TadG